MEIVILPGLDGTGLLLEDFCASLPSSIKTRLIHYPTAEALVYSRLASFVEEKIRNISEYVILAESFSGPVAAKIGASNPKGLRGIIFVASFVSSPRPAMRLFSPLSEFFPFHFKPIFHVASRLLFGRKCTRLQRESLSAALLSVDKKTIAARVRSALSAEMQNELFEIAVPVFYIGSENDLIVTEKSCRPFRQANAQISLINGPHFLLQTKPAECAALVSQFINSLAK